MEKIEIYQNPSRNEGNDNKCKGGNVREKQEKKKNQTNPAQQTNQKAKPEAQARGKAKIR